MLRKVFLSLLSKYYQLFCFNNVNSGWTNVSWTTVVLMTQASSTRSLFIHISQLFKLRSSCIFPDHCFNVNSCKRWHSKDRMLWINQARITSLNPMEITSLNQKVWINWAFFLFSDWSQIMAMAAEVRVQAEVEEEENFGPQPLCRLEVQYLIQDTAPLLPSDCD